MKRIKEIKSIWVSQCYTKGCRSTAMWEVHGRWYMRLFFNLIGFSGYHIKLKCTEHA